jgi:hypothetical protein
MFWSSLEQGGQGSPGSPFPVGVPPSSCMFVPVAVLVGGGRCTVFEFVGREGLLREVAQPEHVVPLVGGTASKYAV